MDYEYNSFAQYNNDYHEVFKTGEINNLSTNSKYILQINHKDGLIYENSFYTLNSPLIKLDEYFSDDQNIYFILLLDY